MKAAKNPRQAQSVSLKEPERKRLQLALKREKSKNLSLAKKAAKIEQEYTLLKAQYHKNLNELRTSKKEHAELQTELEQLRKQLTWFQKQYFGSTTETNLPLNVDHDDECVESAQAPGEDKPRKRGQQRGSKGHGRTDRSHLPQDDPEIIEVTDKCCPTCRKPYSEAGTDDSSIVELETRIYVRTIRRQKVAAHCKCAPARIITAPPAPKLYPKTSIGNSVWVHLVIQKMLFGMPTNRILKELALKGLGISAGTATGGFEVINQLVKPFYEQIKLHCQQCDMWNADETSWRVFEDADGVRSSKKWWLWIVASSVSVVYILDRTRSGAVPENFFEESSGVAITDRYAAYNSLPKSVKKAWCWVHVRRDFVKVFEGLPKLRNWSRQWLLDIAELFVLHHKRFELWTAKQLQGKPWLDANYELASHVENMEKNWKEQLRKAVHAEQKTILNSLKRHWQGLTLFLDDSRIPLENNRAERLLRNSVVQRKNSYGNGSEWGGYFSAHMFSILQTWLINGLDPEALLLDYFNECSKTPGIPPPTEEIAKFLPWKMNEATRAQFKLPASFKRPG